MNFGPSVRHLNIDQIQKYFRVVLFGTFSYSGELVEWIRDFRGSCYSLLKTTRAAGEMTQDDSRRG